MLAIGQIHNFQDLYRRTHNNTPLLIKKKKGVHVANSELGLRALARYKNFFSEFKSEFQT